MKVTGAKDRGTAKADGSGLTVTFTKDRQKAITLMEWARGPMQMVTNTLETGYAAGRRVKAHSLMLTEVSTKANGVKISGTGREN